MPGAKSVVFVFLFSYAIDVSPHGIEGNSLDDQISVFENGHASRSKRSSPDPFGEVGGSSGLDEADDLDFGEDSDDDSDFSQRSLVPGGRRFKYGGFSVISGNSFQLPGGRFILGGGGGRFPGSSFPFVGGFPENSGGLQRPSAGGFPSGVGVPPTYTGGIRLGVGDNPYKNGATYVYASGLQRPGGGGKPYDGSVSHTFPRPGAKGNPYYRPNLFDDLFSRAPDSEFHRPVGPIVDAGFFRPTINDLKRPRGEEVIPYDRIPFRDSHDGLQQPGGGGGGNLYDDVAFRAGPVPYILADV